MWKIFQNVFKHAKNNQHKTILVVDDGELERKFISQSLERAGYKVITAASGEDGLKMARESKPDLVILDYYMPGMIGKVVCQQIKGNKETADIPVIFLTGSVKPKDVIDCYDVGADYYLSKPINARVLVRQVELTFQTQTPLKIE